VTLECTWICVVWKVAPWALVAGAAIWLGIEVIKEFRK